MAEKAYLAIDMGASSGRHLLGLFNGRQVRLEEVHRFDNGAIELDGRLHWDILHQWNEVRHGIRMAGDRRGGDIVSVGVDTWGLDFVLLGKNNELLGNPYHYRDSRTDGMVGEACAIVPREEIFRHTGLQFMQINSLYQLLAMKRAKSSVLDAAESLLMIPDFFHWLLAGVQCNEMTDASTTQFYDPVAGDWAKELLRRFDLPSHILGKITPPGTTLGRLRPNVIAESGLKNAVVSLPGTHDTASAVVAVPSVNHVSSRSNWCYVSLGTWALMGLESPRPMMGDAVLNLNFTNEAGVYGTTRVLKNIAGMWLLQECRRVWNLAGQRLDWEDINRLIAEASPLESFVNPDAAELLAPENMPKAIAAFCQRTGQRMPETFGAVARCALESIALKFRHVFAMCESLSGGRIDTIHIVGGGVRNRLLCQATADACQRRVVAGPIEATAIGNLMMQAAALGDVTSLTDIRDIVRHSFDVDEYLPRNTQAWDDAYERFLKTL
jgi:rhamnulokinase